MLLKVYISIVSATWNFQKTELFKNMETSYVQTTILQPGLSHEVPHWERPQNFHSTAKGRGTGNTVKIYLKKSWGCGRKEIKTFQRQSPRFILKEIRIIANSGNILH